MNAVLMLDDNVIVQLGGAVLSALARVALWALWLAVRGVAWFGWLVRPVGLAIGLAAIVALCAVVPALPVGLAITAALGWATMPRGKAVKA